MNKKTIKTIIIGLAIASALAIGVTGAMAEESRFRKDFYNAYTQNKFEGLAYLIKQNKKSVPAEVQSIVSEALAEGKSYAEKMELLELANVMATMHKEWNKDEAPLSIVEKAQKDEIRKENERAAEAEKWAAKERFLGAFLMRSARDEMQAKNVEPVIYPHWMHRLLYDCNTCHSDLFQMKRGATPLTHAAFDAGKTCGACHDGKTSFSTAAKDQCERCHAAGKAGEEKLLKAGKADLKGVKEAAVRIGSTFAPEKLKDGILPVDKFGAIDWSAMKALGAYEPLKKHASAGKDGTKEVRDNEILFEPVMPYVKSVLFSHKTHTELVACSACHQTLFKDSLGANAVTMKEMSEGRSCGACHNKVAFRFADCNRCHSIPNGTPAGKALQRKK